MNFIKWRNLYFFISLAVIIPGLISLGMFGLRPAIDFTGGSLLEVQFTGLSANPTATVSATLEKPSPDGITQVVSEVYDIQGVQQSGEASYIVRGKPVDNDTKNVALGALQEKYGVVMERQFSTVGPTLGRETLVKMVTAIAIVAGIIMLYVWKQFSELKYGVSAIAAMLHDSLVLLGVFSILGVVMKVEVDVLFVTALLTTLSFSVHDTIVVYDRIRELSRKHRTQPFELLVNTAIIETLSRSVNNSFTIIIMLLSLALLGGETIRWFAVALLVGAITGTYSSTFTAAPLLLLWEQVKQARLAKPKK